MPLGHHPHDRPLRPGADALRHPGLDQPQLCGDVLVGDSGVAAQRRDDVRVRGAGPRRRRHGRTRERHGRRAKPG